MIFSLEKHSEDKNIRDVCIKMLTSDNQRYCNPCKIVEAEVLPYLKKQYKEDKRVLTFFEIAEIALYNLHEDMFLNFISEGIFKNNDIELYRAFVHALIRKLYFPGKPNYQRIYKKITNEACTWNDNTATGEWLSFTYYINEKDNVIDGGDDEIFEMVINAGDGVFQVFIETLLFFEREAFYVRLF